VLRQVNEIMSLKAGDPLNLPPARYKRILIIRTDRMGDVILSTPAISALRGAYPQAYLAMVVRPYTRDIVAGNPDLDEVFIYDKDRKEKGLLSTWRFCRNLARKKFDLAVTLNPSNRSHLIPFLAGIPERVGYDRKLGFLLTTRVEDRKFEGKKHEIEYTLDIVRAAGVRPLGYDTFMPIPPESEAWAEEILKKQGVQPQDRLVVLNPAASDDSKIWPPAGYAQVADKLAQKGLKIIILGGPGDRKIAGEVIKHLSCPYINMVGNNNISQAASIIKRSSLFISSDTGPMHLASSLKVAVIAILGRSQPGLSPRRRGPHNENSLVIHKDVGCKECLPQNCPKAFLCMKAITADEVVKAAEKLLGLENKLTAK
jgi:lipopolysaccharide heptosyltransferase II